MTPAQLTAFLAAAALGLIEGINLFIGPVQDRPETETIVGVLPYAGARASEQQFGSAALAYEWPRLQIITRGPVDDLEAALAMAQGCYETLGAVQAQIVGGTLYHRITCLQPPHYLRHDSNRRPLVVFNIEPEKRV